MSTTQNIHNKEEKENGKITNSLKSNQENINEKDEDNLSELSDMKVFNGLVQDDKIIKKANHKKNQEPNKNQNNNKKDFDSYFNDNKNVELNFISFGDCDNLFFNNNNISKKIEEEEKEEKKNSKNKQKNANFKKPIFVNNLSNIKNSKISTIEENPSSESSKRNNNESYVPKGVFMTTEGMLEKERESKEFINPFIVNKEKNKEDQISRNFADSKNYFRISSIHQGNALVVTGDDIVFNFPAIMLPKGAKLGETFTIEIKSLDTSFAYKNEKAMEIENIQRKYLPNDVSKEMNNKK